jgi:hypothetical protein
MVRKLLYAILAFVGVSTFIQLMNKPVLESQRAYIQSGGR